MQRRQAILGMGAMLAWPGSVMAGVPAPIMTYERLTGGHVGLYAHNLRTGAELQWRTGERFAMCSTFKASLAALVLLKVDRGEERLDRPIAFTSADVPDWWAPVAKANLGRGALSVEEMCQASVEQSDNTCANLLLRSIGGPAALTRFWRGMGIRDIRLDDDEPQLNRVAPGSSLNTTTPDAMGLVLRQLLMGSTLSQSSRTRLRDWMIGCKTGANRLRAGLPSAWTIADKTGNNGADAAGDIAMAWPSQNEPIIICAYTRGGNPTTEQLTDLFAGIGRYVARRLG